jgi:hypothetical protein
MRGHEKIIEMRRNRFAPKIVFVNDWPCKTDWFEHQDHATVCTHGDSIEALDLRFLVGLTVSISSHVEVRAKALAKACREACAATVAACHIQPGVLHGSGWVEVWRISDAKVA